MRFPSVFWFCIGHHLRRFVLHPGGQLLYIIVFAERGHLLRIVRWGVWGQGFDGADCLGVLWKANDLDSKGGNYDSNIIQTISYTVTVSMFYILYRINSCFDYRSQPKASRRIFTRHTLLQKGCQNNMFWLNFASICMRPDLLNCTVWRPFYRSALENIRRYVERDLRRLDRPPSILCACKPRSVLKVNWLNDI